MYIVSDIFQLIFVCAGQCICTVALKKKVCFISSAGTFPACYFLYPYNEQNKSSFLGNFVIVGFDCSGSKPSAKRTRSGATAD